MTTTTTIATTFAALRAANISIHTKGVHIYANGDMFAILPNQSRDLRATRPWTVKLTDTCQKEFFAGVGLGTYKVEAGYQMPR